MNSVWMGWWRLAFLSPDVFQSLGSQFSVRVPGNDLGQRFGAYGRPLAKMAPVFFHMLSMPIFPCDD